MFFGISEPVLRPFPYVNGFYRAYFVAAETPNAVPVIDDHFWRGTAKVHYPGSADTGTIAAAGTEGMINFRPRRKEFHQLSEWPAKDKIQELGF